MSSPSRGRPARTRGARSGPRIDNATTDVFFAGIASTSVANARHHARATSSIGGARSADLILSFLAPADLLNLRRASRATALLADRALPRLFATLHHDGGHGVAASTPSLRALRRVGWYCRNLTIRIRPGPDQTDQAHGLPYSPMWSRETIRADGASSASNDGVRPPSPTHDPSRWRDCLRQLPNLMDLTISCTGVPAWPGWSAVEQSLVSIRQALESGSNPALTTVRLCPIHAIGVLHLRWAGGAAYGNASWSAGLLWRRLTRLEICLANPAGLLAKDQQKMFVKALHDYLASFSHSLEELHFQWTGHTGPNPLLLEEVAWRGRRSGSTSFSAPPLTWRRLRSIGLQNCGCQATHLKLLFWERSSTLAECTIRGAIQGTAQAFAELRASGIEWSKIRSDHGTGAATDVWSFKRMAPSSQDHLHRHLASYDGYPEHLNLPARADDVDQRSSLDGQNDDGSIIDEGSIHADTGVPSITPRLRGLSIDEEDGSESSGDIPIMFIPSTDLSYLHGPPSFDTGFF